MQRELFIRERQNRQNNGRTDKIVSRSDILGSGNPLVLSNLERGRRSL